MAIQVLVLLVAATVAVCAGENQDDRTVAFARLAHQTFLETSETGYHTNFTYGLETKNAATGVTNGIVSTRLGAPAKGSFYTLMPGGEQLTVEFTVDTPEEFRATTRRDVQTQPVLHDYGRISAPLAYTSRPAPEGTPMTLIRSREDAREIGPIQAEAFKVQTVTNDFFQLKPPYNATMGYQKWYEGTGQIRSHYMSLQGRQGEGRVVLMEPDGTYKSMTMVMNDTGFYVTTAVAHEP